MANLLRPMNGMSSELIKWKYKIVKTLKEYICRKPWFSQLSWYLVFGIEGKKRIWYLLKAGFDHSQLIKIICYKKSRILKINFVIIWFGLVFDKMDKSAYFPFPAAYTLWLYGPRCHRHCAITHLVTSLTGLGWPHG